MRKYSKFMLIFTLVILVVMAGAGYQAFAQKKKLVIWGWDFRATKDIAPQIEQFKAKHPDVEIEAIDMGPGDLHDKFLIATISGTGAPDVTFEVDTMSRKYYEMGTVYPLTDLIPNHEELFIKAINYRWTHEGELMGAPYDTGPFVIFYRKDILDDAGIDFTTNVTNMQEFLEVGKKITIPDKRYMSVIFAGQLQPFVQSRGGKISNIKNELLFDNPIVAEVAQYMVDVVNKYKIAEYSSPWTPAGYEKVKEGRWVCLPMWYWYQSFALKDIAYKPELVGKWRIARMLPWRKGDPPTGADFTCGGIFLVSKQTQYPDLAKELAASLCSKEAQADQARRRGIFPVNVQALEELSRWEDPFFGGQRPFKIGLELLRDTPVMQFGSKYSVIEGVLTTAMDRMIFDGVPVTKAIKDAKKQAEVELK